MKAALLALIFVRLGFGQYSFVGSWCADAGSTDAYACTLPLSVVAYSTGALYAFKANTANTGAATINFNSLGAKTIVKVAGGVTTALADNDIRAGQVVLLQYDGTNMQMQSTLGNAASGTGDVVGPSSATDNAVSRFDSTTGKLIQNSLFIVDDSGNASTPGSISGASLSTGGSPPTVTGTGVLAMGETTGQTCAASAVDCIKADSASHKMLSSLNNGSFFALPQVIAHASKALDFGSTATGACATVITDTATGALSTDVILFTTNASIKAVTGFVPASTGGFSINAYPTADTVNFEACNWTAGTVDPGSITVNWMVIR